MDKFIFTAKSERSLIGLLKDTKSFYRNAKWDLKSAFKSNDRARCESESELRLAYDAGDFKKIDDLIMSGEVPVGGLVVVCDGSETPSFGYVCGNGTSWFQVSLSKELVDAVMEFYPPIEFGVKFGFKTKRFNTREELGNFVESTFNVDNLDDYTYADLKEQFDSGVNVLEYGSDWKVV